jgi:hypothetical protein
MSWRKYLNCRIMVHHQGKTYLWEKDLPLPIEIPLRGLFVHSLPIESSTLAEKRGLSLQIRKVLWAYENIDQQVWKRAARDLNQWLIGLPCNDATALNIDAHEAGVAVAMTLLSEHLKCPKLIIKTHNAPLAWLKKRFMTTPRRVKWENAIDPQSPWGQLPTLSGKRFAA